MTKSAHTIDMNTADGLAEHMATLPTENLRRIADRPTNHTNVALVYAAECELALRESAPTCERHGSMTKRPVAGQSAEQRWCGTWWDCDDPGCRSSFLVSSPELDETK